MTSSYWSWPFLSMIQYVTKWPSNFPAGRVFDLTLPLDRVAEGYRAMDERRAIKALLLP
jgi:hypothetical protein